MNSTNVYAVTVQRFYTSLDGYHYQMADNHPLVGLYRELNVALNVASELTGIWTGDNNSIYSIQRYPRCSDYEAAFVVLENKTPVTAYTVREVHILP